MAKPNKVLNILLYAVLAGYVVLMLDLLFFSRVYIVDGQFVPFRSLNYIPFFTISGYITGGNALLAISNVLGNIVLFIPCGIYVFLFSKKKNFIPCILLVMGLSLGVEAIQYLFGLGSTDIDDLILNTIGGAVGILLCWFIQKCAKSEAAAKNTVAFLSSVIGIPLIGLSVLLIVANM